MVARTPSITSTALASGFWYRPMEAAGRLPKVDRTPYCSEPRLMPSA